MGDTTAPSDETLMSRFQQGHNDAFEHLLRRWEQPMLNYFYRSLGDADVAEDLRQDLFVRLYVRRSSYRGEGSFRAWLYSIAANLVRTHYRKAKPLVAAANTNDGEQLSELPEENTAAEGSAHQAVQRSETARLVRQLLSDLDANDRDALILRFFEKLPYREISRALGIAESSAKSRVYRAVERLRQAVVSKGLTAEELL